jgi:hypothetical protein
LPRKGIFALRHAQPAKIIGGSGLSAPSTGPGFAAHIALPAGHWNGERAATDMLALARKGKAFRSLNKLLVRQGGPQVLAGSALALAAAVTAHPQHGDTPTRDLLNNLIR